MGPSDEAVTDNGTYPDGTNTQRVTVAPFIMPRATMDRLRARAAADDRSIAATIRVAIERFLGASDDDGRNDQSTERGD